MQQPQFRDTDRSRECAAAFTNDGLVRRARNPSWKILLKDLPTMLAGRDGTEIIGPFDAATVIDMVENGSIDKDSSFISFCPDPAFISLSGSHSPQAAGKELELHKLARSQARVAPLVLPAHEPAENTEGPLPLTEGRTESDDCNAYHVIVQIIDVTTDTSCALLQQVDWSTLFLATCSWGTSFSNGSTLAPRPRRYPRGAD